MTTTSKFRPSHRGSSPSTAEQLQTRARKVEAAGTRVSYLNVGQPSTGAPQGTLQAIEAASHNSTLGYTAAAGLTELRERLARQYGELNGVDVDPERIIVTLGASGAMILSIVGCFDERQRLGLPQPFYYGYRYAMEILGVECVRFPTSMKNGFQPTIADIEAIDGGIDGLVIASPNNPTGSMIRPAALKELAEYCESHQIRLISDEIYHGIVFRDDVSEMTAITYSDEAIVVNSFSKYYSMAGWRLGWMVVPDYLAEPIANLAHNLYLCASAASQIGALHAIDCREELDRHVERYRHNRNLMLKRLPAMGFDRFCAPHGAFYLYCHVRHMHEDSLAFCIEMLEGAGVLVAPGSDFCPDSGRHFVRFSYAGATEQIEEALDRIERWRSR
ncbi:MAG: aminotransferase class I/II-fold pyridoxal phosphate-dependent enzyme [Myxococcota bacterium]|jgi:aspartate/methionine/tyrosine aminotransferase|nr:aminotransferase class I/II-fold pyridoxal phosphate-dependent enzyme [bacterium]MDP6073542.1 aminotransferase class I/II-fold pyridoxal phosphate-dependent enzyme [Myxococcota bacterium]MDP7073180.1 aminotransferase class I/II-fold pyridoxal phosphate-dependent enzyme [Myxococcota bacterium]MDP7301384.1 aminotransferase class I/II-fold pyridoxal phosphate-dependent enzyme [Myxococcota bacterium]MDP7434216.1 aminotransferase class I/II-fold pyridoxal phosphate-dependent enzyme [Myxococcota b